MECSAGRKNSMEEFGFLRDLVIVFGCAAPISYLFHRLHQSPIVGFVLTGALVGPYGFSLIGNVDDVNVLATIGVMILLFSLGLEFSLKKLMETRAAVFLVGPLQVAGTAVAVILIARYMGMTLGSGIIYGVLIAVSSTTVVLKMLAERGEVDSVHGRICLGVSIFQDLCTIPLMVAIPLMGIGGSPWRDMSFALGKAVAIVIAVIVIARYIFPILLRGILSTRSKELFLITAVFMFLGTAWVTSNAGISLALGSFLAGLILSESEYGHHIFAEVRPFRDSLNSLFFIAVGMLVDLGFIGRHLGVILALTLAIAVGKAVFAAGATLATGIPVRVAILSGVALAQVGEFSFVLLQEASRAGMVGRNEYQIILSASLVTMALTPVTFAAIRRLLSRWMAFAGGVSWSQAADPAVEELQDHVIICGFGVGGRNIASVLKANAIPYVILDLNAQTVREARKGGEPMIFGDCTSTHMLRTAGINKARVIVFVISDPFANRLAVRIARDLNRELVILTRTRYVAEIDELWSQGSTEVIADEFEASLELMTRILRVYNAPRAMVAAEIKSIRSQRFGIFRERQSTVPRIRLSSDLDVYTETWKAPENWSGDGVAVAESRLKGETGVLILGIIRGTETLNNPGPSEPILSGDLLVLSGTKDQLNKAIQMLNRYRPVGAIPS